MLWWKFLHILKAEFFLFRKVCETFMQCIYFRSSWGSNTCHTSKIHLTSKKQSCHNKFIITFEIKCYYENSCRFWKLSSFSFEKYATRLCNLYISISKWGSNTCFTSKIDFTSNQQSCHSKFFITFEIKCNDENSCIFWKLSSFSLERYAKRLCNVYISIQVEVQTFVTLPRYT